MTQHIINYFHPALAIGLEDVRNAWLLLPGKEPVQLKTVVYQGNLVYRLPQSGKRVSYRSVKKGLVRKKIIIRRKEYTMPF